MHKYFSRLTFVGLVGQCLLIGLGLLAFAMPVHAETLMPIVEQVSMGTHITDGFLFEDTTWTASGSPYYIGADMTVPMWRTLRIEPGVVVVQQFDGREMFIVPVIGRYTGETARDPAQGRISHLDESDRSSGRIRSRHEDHLIDAVRVERIERID